MIDIKNILDEEKEKVVTEYLAGSRLTSNLGAFLNGMEYLSEALASSKYTEINEKQYFVHLVHTKGTDTIPLSGNDLLRAVQQLHKKRGPIRFKYHLANHGWKTIYLEALLIQGNIKRKEPKTIMI